MKKKSETDCDGPMTGEDSALLTLVPSLFSLGKTLSMGYGQPLDSYRKKDGSMVTSMDLLSHERLIELLQSISQHPILSEEKIIPYEDRKNWEKFWMIDPLDGTKAYINGRGEFCVNIVFIHKKRPIEAIILSPLKREIFYAKKGKGVFLISYRKNLVPLPQKIRKNPTFFCSELHEGNRMKIFRQNHPSFQFEPLSSALKFCYVAATYPSYYLRFAGSSEWDISAGDLIVSESGGKMISLLDQKAIEYNSQSLRSPMFLAYSMGCNPFPLSYLYKNRFL